MRRGDGPVERDAFAAWFASHPIYKCLSSSLATAAYDRCGGQMEGASQPRWDILHNTLAIWPMPHSEMPTWKMQFITCFHRYMLKRLRLRSRLAVQLLIMVVLSLISGFGQGPSVPDTAVMLVGTISLYCVFFSTCAIESVLQGESSALFEHEGASGIRQSAEISARLLGDLLIWLPAPLLYGLPYIGLANIRGAVERGQFFVILYLLAFAMKPFAYIATIISRPNSVIIVSSLAMVLSVFLSGHVGPNLRDEPQLLAISPPKWALHAFCLVFLSSLPFDSSRIYFAEFLARQHVLIKPGNSTMDDLRYLITQTSNHHALFNRLRHCEDARGGTDTGTLSIESMLLAEARASRLTTDGWFAGDMAALVMFGFCLRMLTVLVFVNSTTRQPIRKILWKAFFDAHPQATEAVKPDDDVKRKVRATMIKTSRASVNNAQLNRPGADAKPEDAEMGVKLAVETQRQSHFPRRPPGPPPKDVAVPPPKRPAGPAPEESGSVPPPRQPPTQMLDRVTEERGTDADAEAVSADGELLGHHKLHRDGEPSMADAATFGTHILDNDYIGEDEGELTLVEGTRVLVIGELDLETGWTLCKDEQGNEGFLPTDWLEPASVNNAQLNRPGADAKPEDAEMGVKLAVETQRQSHFPRRPPGPPPKDVAVPPPKRPAGPAPEESGSVPPPRQPPTQMLDRVTEERGTDADAEAVSADGELLGHHKLHRDGEPSMADAATFGTHILDNDYIGEDEGELTLVEGTRVLVIGELDLETGWTLCKDEQGNEGFLPTDWLEPAGK